MQLCWKRLTYYLWFDPTHPLAKNLVYRVSYVLALILGIPGIVLAVHRHKMDTAIVLAFFGFLALYVPVIVLPRYRIIPLLFLLLMAAYAVDVLWTRVERHRAARENSQPFSS
jgi:hypothetical protein